MWKDGLLRAETLRGLARVTKLMSGRTSAGTSSPAAAPGLLLFSSPSVSPSMTESGGPGFLAELLQGCWACTNEFAPSHGKFSWLLNDSICRETCWTPGLLSVDDRRAGDNSSLVDSHVCTMSAEPAVGFRQIYSLLFPVLVMSLRT